MLVLGYHADDEILRWWAIVGGAGAVLILVLALRFARRPRPSKKRAVLPVVALALAGLTALALGTGFYVVGVAFGFLALVPAVTLAGARRSWLGLAGFLAGALAFDVGASALAACMITDACFH